MITTPTSKPLTNVPKKFQAASKAKKKVEIKTFPASCQCPRHFLKVVMKKDNNNKNKRHLLSSSRNTDAATGSGLLLVDSIIIFSVNNYQVLQGSIQIKLPRMTKRIKMGIQIFKNWHRGKAEGI